MKQSSKYYSPAKLLVSVNTTDPSRLQWGEGEKKVLAPKKVLEDVSFPFPKCCWYAEKSLCSSFRTAGTLLESHPPCEILFCQSAHSVAHFSSLGGDGSTTSTARLWWRLVGTHHGRSQESWKKSPRSFLLKLRLWPTKQRDCGRSLLATAGNYLEAEMEKM